MQNAHPIPWKSALDELQSVGGLTNTSGHGDKRQTNKQPDSEKILKHLLHVYESTEDPNAEFMYINSATGELISPGAGNPITAMRREESRMKYLPLQYHHSKQLYSPTYSLSTSGTKMTKNFAHVFRNMYKEEQRSAGEVNNSSLQSAGKQQISTFTLPLT